MINVCKDLWLEFTETVLWIDTSFNSGIDFDVLFYIFHSPLRGRF